MFYIVFDKSNGQIVRSYQKVTAESGDSIPAEHSEITANLPMGLAENQVEVIQLETVDIDKGKSYKVDVHTKQLIAQDIKSK